MRNRVALWCGVVLFVAGAAMGETGPQPDKEVAGKNARTACTVRPQHDGKQAADARTLGDLLRAGCEPSEAVEMLSHFPVGVTPPFLAPELSRPAAEKKMHQQENKGTRSDR